MKRNIPRLITGAVLIANIAGLLILWQQHISQGQRCSEAMTSFSNQAREVSGQISLLLGRIEPLAHQLTQNSKALKEQEADLLSCQQFGEANRDLLEQQSKSAQEHERIIEFLRGQVDLQTAAHDTQRDLFMAMKGVIDQNIIIVDSTAKRVDQHSDLLNAISEYLQQISRGRNKP